MSRFAIGRPVRRRSRVRAFNGETASRALREGGFGPGREVFGFNKGQFSVIDLIEAALGHTGPAHATICTWTAANADLKRTAQFMREGRMLSARWLVDYTFETRQPQFCQLLRELFGDEAIRTTACHAKFVLLRAAEWRVVVQSSMNLNQNKRIENFWVCDDPELFAAYDALVSDVFGVQATGEGFGAKPKVRRAELAALGAESEGADGMAGPQHFVGLCEPHLEIQTAILPGDE